MKNSLLTILKKIVCSSLLCFAYINSQAQTVYDFISSSPNHTTLTAAIDAAGLDSVLSGTGEYTVFAPTDDAFVAALGELGLTAEELLASDGLADILTYHVIGSSVLSTDLTNGMTPTPLNDVNTIKVTVGDAGVFVNQAQVVSPDNETGNGVVHVTDGVILASETVVDVALSTGVHNTLVAAVIEAELLPALTNPFAELTVFAPTDDAFVAALGEVGLTAEELLASDGLADILTYHVIGSIVLSTDLTNGMTPTPLNDDNTIKVTVGDAGVFVNQAQVVIPDNQTGNGVVHVTDAVILASETVVDVALSTGVHNTLVAAVIEAELLPALTNPFAELTIFAPTDDAFISALGELGLTAEELLASDGLADILTYHVIGSSVLSTDLTNGMTPTPLNDVNTIKVTVGDFGVFVNQAQVIIPDNQTENGVVHVTDGVILASETVVDIALSTGVHNTLVAAVIEAELLPVLTNPFAELTVFAPTDDAFIAALDELGLTAEELLASDGLADILKNHVVGSVAMSSDLSDGMMIESLLGDDLIVGISDEVISINNAVVITADVTSNNGVVHVVDAVINNSTSNVQNVVMNEEDSYYLYTVDLSGKIIDSERRFHQTHQIVFDVYNSGKVIKRFSIQQ